MDLFPEFGDCVDVKRDFLALVLDFLGVRHRLHFFFDCLLVLLLGVFEHELGFFTVKNQFGFLLASLVRLLLHLFTSLHQLLLQVGDFLLDVGLGLQLADAAMLVFLLSEFVQILEVVSALGELFLQFL